MKAPPEMIAALHAADVAFEPHLRPRRDLCMSCGPPFTAEQITFDATIRAYRRRRLELPIAAITFFGATFGHGSAIVHSDARRLAWFVPTFLAASLRDDFAGSLRALTCLFRELPTSACAVSVFSPEETSALAAFLTLAVAWRCEEAPHVEGDIADLASLAIAANCRESVINEATRARLEDGFSRTQNAERAADFSRAEAFVRDALVAS